MLEMVRAAEGRAGDALESEMALCRRFGVSRPLVRRALAEMGQKGLILSVPGKGHFLADPNQSASPRSGVVVCVSGSTRPEFMGPDAHVSKIMEGLGQAMQESPYRLLWEIMGARQRGVSEMVKPHLADLRGVVLAPLSDQSVPEMLASLPPQAKRVVAGRPGAGVPCAYVNHYAGMVRAMQYLIGQGHRHIGYVRKTERALPTLRQFDAYRDILKEAGLPHNSRLIVETSEEPEHIEQVVTSLLDRAESMTALVVAAGGLLPWALRAAQNRGKRVGQDLSVIASDDVPFSRQHLPAITVIREPTRQMGLVAGRMLLQLMEGRPVPAQEVVLECELIVRDSVVSV
jgi:LacI family transcriptional regulator